MAYFKIVFQDMPVGTKNIHKNLRIKNSGPLEYEARVVTTQSQYSVCV